MSTDTEDWGAKRSAPDKYGSEDDYYNALVALDERGISSNHRAMLLEHLSAPNQTVTWADLAQVVGYQSYKVVNLQYGAFAHRLADAMGVTEAPLKDLFPPKGWWGYVLVEWADQPGALGHTAYVMRPPLAAALRRLDWRMSTSDGLSSKGRRNGSPPRPPEEDLGDAEDIYEPPAHIYVKVRRILRDTAIVRELKELHGNTCQRCGLRLAINRSKFYSEGHHLRPLGAPHKGPDTRPNILVLCPNCHALLDYAAVTLEPKRLRTHDDHEVAAEFIDYHNALVRRRRGS